MIYQAALNNSPVSPKTNYNLASISVRNPKRLNETIQYYQTATSVLDFPYARINGALLLSVSEGKKEAIELLSGGDHVGEAVAERLNNLGVILRQEGQADSAVVAFQKALLKSPQLAAAAVNLAEVYRENDRPEEALSFYQLALESNELSAPVLAAGLEYELSTEAGLTIPASSSEFQDPLLTYHEMLHQWHQGDSLDWKEVQQLASASSEQGPVILDLLRQFSLDSVDYAKSKTEYLSDNFPSRAAGLWNVLGGAYLDRSVPEMAEYCFHQAAETGSGKGQFLEAQLMLDQGKLDSALVKLGEARITDESLWEPVSKELAMLLLAQGQDVYAGLEY
ncbi:MAG: tetratricopeptide repeat protein, partial [Endozoicomonas sp.]